MHVNFYSEGKRAASFDRHYQHLRATSTGIKVGDYIRAEERSSPWLSFVLAPLWAPGSGDRTMQHVHPHDEDDRIFKYTHPNENATRKTCLVVVS